MLEFKEYDENIKGKPVSIIAKRGIYFLDSNGTSAGGIELPQTNNIGILTGYFSKDSDKYYVQIKFSKSIYNEAAGKSYSLGYANTVDLLKFENGTHLQAQNTLDDVLYLHKSILEKNLLCARGLELMAESGAAVPIEFKQRLFNLQAKLINRNNTLKNGGHVQNIQEGEHPQLSKYNQALVNFMNAPGIGFVISGTAIIIITAVVSTVISSIVVYNIMKSMQKDAKVDFGLSNNLTADLIKYLPKPVYDQLMKELAANAKIANDAISDASTGGIMKTVKTGALILAGIWIADKFIFNKRTNN